MRIMLHLLFVLICACSVRSQAVCDGCLCDPPDIDSTTVKSNYLVRKIIEDSSISWALDVNITWTAPLNTSHDYGVQLTKHNGGDLRCFGTKSNRQLSPSLTFICPIRLSQQHVTGELYTEKDISFGYRYIFDVCLYNATSNALAPISICITSLYSPDCYEETQDEGFCRNQPIVVSGKPVNASFSHFKLGENTDDTATIDAVIVWSDPIQVNGAINRHIIETYDVNEPDVREDHQVISYAEGDANTSIVYEAHIPGLSSYTQYRVEITPWVIIPSDGLAAGLKAEVFFTTPSTSDLTTSMATNIATVSETPIATEDATPIETTMMVQAKMTAQTQMQVVVTTGPGIDVLTISIVTSIAMIFLVILLILAVICVRLRKRRMNTPYVPKPPALPATVSRRNSIEDDYLRDVDPVFMDKEVRHYQVKIGEQLGSGQFGIVYSGRLVGSTKSLEHPIVAVKTVKDNVKEEIKNDFLNEIRLMIEIGRHQNVMEVLACCTAKLPYYMVIEMLKYGDLLNFLRKCNKPKHIQDDSIYNISDLQRYQVARQIANGMIFISSKRFYHGDLAARNILVGSDLLVKISDFGLSNDIYQEGYQRLALDRKRPVKWASIETNLEGICTIQSDIWSYGVVLYEIFTNGRVPYKDIDGREVVWRVRDGYRLAKPNNCPDDVYDLMLRCWRKNPGSRPSFKNLFNFFDKKIAATSPSGYLDMENEEPTSEGTEPAIQRELNASLNDGSAAFSGESVNLKEWAFERDSSTRQKEALNEDASKYSCFKPEGLIYERYKDSDKTG